MDPARELGLLVGSGHGLVVVETMEEDRLEEILRQVAASARLVLYVWTLTRGLHVSGQDGQQYDTKDPERALAAAPTLSPHGIWLFKDLHPFLDQAVVVRCLRELAGGGPVERRSVVLSGPSVSLPPDLDRIAVRFPLAPPSERELSAIVHAVVEDLRRFRRIAVSLDDATYRRLLSGLQGLTRREAERAVARAALDDDALTAEDVSAIHAARRALLAADGVLEYVPPDSEAVSLGGLEAFKDWLGKRRQAFTPEARAFGLPPPKGVVLLGVQGSGKTMAARTVAASWGLPLLRMEPGRLYEKYLGESEKNLERILGLAEHLAPCVLLLDEIEKGLGGSEGAEADGGVARRLLGRFLGWLQDRRAPVFVVATSNRIADLPPELLRKGRFDEIFFVDLPGAQARREILRLHLRARGRDPDRFDLDALVAASEGFSGAELAQAIVAGLYTAFSRGGDLDTALLLAELAATRPLSVTRREEVEALRRWARERAVPAD